MKKQIGKLLGRLKSTRRARSGRLRKLRLESLEGRRLLAADLAANHNYIIAEDVNQDFLVSPLDALLVINALNQGGSRSFGEGEVSAEMVAKLDVNGDNYLSPIDVLTVINRLNAEGEDTAEFIIAYSYEITDTNGAPLSGDVVVGDTFRINAYVKDNRDLGPNPDPQVSGVFGAASDLGVSDLSLVQYAPDGFFVPTRANEPHPITVGGHRVRIQGPTEWRFISMVDSAAAGAGTASYDAVTKTLTIAGDSSGATANALVIQDAISALPDFSASGALAAGDGTFTSGTTRVFGFGVTFGTELRNGRNASEGGGLQIAGFKTANVSDGQTFSLTTSSGTVRFEFDWNSDTQPGNTVIGLREPDTESPLGFNEVSSAIVAAVQASGLGLRPENSGDGVVGLPVDQFTLAPETSLLSVSMPASEYFNEITAFSRSSESDDPTVPVPFYSMDFRAEAAGVITFTPNQPDRAGSENLIFGSTIPIPNEMVMFGSPFSVTIIVDPTAPKANDDNVTTAEDTPLTFNGNITTNDTVTAGRTVTIDSLAAISGVTQGTVNGSTYTPPANFNGVDTLTYSVIDSTGLRSGQATVTIQVTAVNDPPVARNDFFSIEESSADNILNVLADNGTGADDGGPN
ncbi:MAG: cadherin-like domain-containing protein, partial [Planctomycetales bacterium]|nr:cadherin-like domain-containing protein [Planctomycetales bacterium]